MPEIPPPSQVLGGNNIIPPPQKVLSGKTEYFDPYVDGIEITGEEKARKTIDSIDFPTESRKQILFNVAKSGAPKEIINESISVLKGTHPHQEGGNKFYLDEMGIPKPLKNNERPPEGFDIESNWGTQAEADDDGLWTSLAKHTANGLLMGAKGFVDLADVAQGLATGSPSGTLQGLKNAADYLKFKTKSSEKEQVFDSKDMKSWTEIFDPERYNFTPDNIQGNILQGYESIIGFALGAKGFGTAAKAVKGLKAGAKKLGKEASKEMIAKTSKTEAIALAAAGGYNLALGEMLDVADEAGLEGRDRYGFAAAGALPVAMLEVVAGPEGLILANKIARAEVKNLARIASQKLEKDASGRLTKEALEQLNREMTVAATTVSKKFGKRVAGNIAGEGLTEAAQEAAKETSKYLYDKISQDPKFNNDIFGPETIGNYVNSAIAGVFGAAGPSIVLSAQERRIAKEKAQSENVFEAVRKGDDAVENLKNSVKSLYEDQKISKEELDNAFTRINAYKEYNDIIGSSALNLEDEQKKEVFEKTFQKQNLEREIEGVDVNTLHPLKQSEFNGKKKQAQELQKDIDGLLEKARLEGQAVKSNKSQETEEEDNEKKPAGKSPLSVSEQIASLRKSNPNRFKDDDRKLEDIPAQEWNTKKISYRKKQRKFADWLENQNKDTDREGIAYAKLKEMPFTWTKKDGKPMENSTWGVELGDMKIHHFGSSMKREDNENLRGNLMIERFSGLTEGSPIGLKVYNIQGLEGEPMKRAIKAFRTDNGKFLGWMKETTKGTASKEYSQTQIDLLGHLETQPEPTGGPDAFDGTGVDPAPVVPGGRANETPTNRSQEPKKPIRQLGTGSNVYFETPAHRVNDSKNGKILLNVGEKGSNFPAANIEFDNVNEAVEIAEEVARIYPEGVPPALLVEKWIETLRGKRAQNLQEKPLPLDNNEKPVSPDIQNEPPSDPKGPRSKGDRKDPKEGEGDPGNKPAENVQADKVDHEPEIEAVRNNPRPKESLKQGEALLQKAEGIFRVPIKDINIDESRFQNRDKLDQGRVDQIAANFNEQEQDPIAVWQDPEGKIWLLAGHHRLAGAKKAGREDILGRFWQGDESGAIEYAKERSNANRGMETPVERAKIYREKRKKGESKKALKEAAEIEGKNANFILNISSLSPTGAVISAYTQFEHSQDKSTQKEIEKLMDWIGEARSVYPLTDAHEKELYDFLTDKDASARFKTKSEFLAKVSSLVSAMDFDAGKPLNIARFKYKSQGETEYEKQWNELDQKLKAYNRQRDEINERFTNPKSKQGFIKKDDPEYDQKRKLADEKIKGIDEKIRKTADDKYQLERNKGNFTNDNQGSFFQKKSSKSQEDVDRVVNYLQKLLPKIKFVYDETLQAAGQLKGDTIRINPYFAGKDTPIHEAAHVLLDALGHDHPLVQQALKQLRGTKLWKDTEADYGHLGERAVENEVLAEAIGRDGADIFDKESEKSAFRKILDQIFDWFKRTFGLEKDAVKSLARQVLRGTDHVSQIEKNQLLGEKAKLGAMAMADLGMAKHMELKGVSAKEIRAMTLWERSKADGKWRYEIQDDGKIIAPEKFLDYFMSVKPGEEIDLGSLTDVYNFKQLYDAYPGVFEGYKVILTNTQERYAARVNEARKVIEFNAILFQKAHGAYHDGAKKNIPVGERGAVKRDIIEKTLGLRGLRRLFGHELQHIIQKQEGFIGGSNPRLADTYLQETYRKEAEDQQGYKDAYGPEKEKFVEDYIAKKVGALDYEDALEATYKRMAGEVEARNVQYERYDMTPAERRTKPLTETEEISKESQILLGIDGGESYDGGRNKENNNGEGEVRGAGRTGGSETNGGTKGTAQEAGRTSKKVKSQFTKFRKDVLGRDTVSEKKELAIIRDLLATDLTAKERDHLLDIRDQIYESMEEDREAYEEYRKEVKELRKFNAQEDLSNYTLDQLIEIYNQARSYEGILDKDLYDSIRERIGEYLNEQRLEELRKVPLFRQKEGEVNQKDLTWMQKWVKALADMSQDFPILQKLSQHYDQAYLDMVKEAADLKKQLEEKGKVVVKEKNRKLGIIGIAKQLVMRDSADYFSFVEQNGKLRTNTSGLTQAQKEFLDLYTKIAGTRQSLNRSTDDLLIKVDKGFSEAWRTDGWLAGVSSWMGNVNDATVTYSLEGKSYTKPYLEAKDHIVKYGKDHPAKAVLKLIQTGYQAKKQSKDPKYHLKNGLLTSKQDNTKKNWSQDHYRAAMAMIDETTHIKHMNKIVPIVDAVEYFYKQLGVDRGDAEKYKHVLGFVKDWKAGHIYHENKVTNPVLDTFLSALRSFTSKVVMGFNLPANLLNVAIGNYNTWRQEGFTHWAKGQQRFFGGKKRGLLGVPSKKAIDLINKYHVVNIDYDSNPKASIGKTFDKMAFFGLRAGEFQIQGSQFLGYFSKEEYGSISYNEKGDLVVPKEVEKKINDYKNRVSEVQGRYGDKDRRNFMRYEMLKSGFQFRLWALEWYETRWGSEIIDSRGNVRVGSWYKMFNGGMREIREDFSKHNIAVAWKNKQMRQNLTGLMFVAALWIGAHADDEDEKTRKEVLSLEYALNQLLFAYDPQQLKYLIESPVASFGTVLRFLDAIQAAIDGDGKKFNKNAKKLVPYYKSLDIFPQDKK